MLRKLLVLTCLAIASKAIGQNANSTPSKITQKQDAAIDYKQMGAPMPELLFIPYYDSLSKVVDRRETMTNSDFDSHANLFVMMFNPTCSHCQDETKLLEKNFYLFKRSKLVLLANMMMKPYLADFVKTVDLNDYPFIYVGRDSLGFINNAYLYQALPQINIYDRDRKLIKIYNGEVAIDSLEKYIQ